MRQELQRLPGAPTQTSRLFSLHAKAADLKQKAADMEAKAVPRPDPPQYGPLWQNVHRFLNGLGSQERIADLLGRLMVKAQAGILSFVHMMHSLVLGSLCAVGWILASVPYVSMSFPSVSKCQAFSACGGTLGAFIHEQ